MLRAGLQRLARQLSPPPPPSPRPAEPWDRSPGAPGSGLRPWADGLPDPALPHDWSHDPRSGEALPPQLDAIPPWRYPEARVLQQHGWFARLSLRHALGDPAALDAALGGIDGWLRQDLPGQGIGWAHGTDPALRLLHWYAALSWLGPALPDRLRAHLAGSARWHLLHLQRRMPTAPAEGLRRTLHLCGLIAGGFAFPGLDGARAARAEGISGLKHAIAEQLHPDGTGLDRAFVAQARMLWAALIARHACRQEGAPFPADADAAIARGAHMLYRLAGPLGDLPSIGEDPVGDLLPASYPLAWSLWNACLALGLDGGASAPDADRDPRLRWLGLSPAALPAAPAPPAPADWSLHAFSSGGLVVASRAVRSRPSRVVVDLGAARGSGLSHPGLGAVLWQVGPIHVLADPGSAGDASDLQRAARAPDAHSRLTVPARRDGAPKLDRARVDGKKARISGTIPLLPPPLLPSLPALPPLPFAALGPTPLSWQRDVLLNQGRLICTDRLLSPASPAKLSVRLCWQLGPGWSVEPSEGGFTAKSADLTLLILLPAALSWSIQQGHPPPEPAGWVRLSGEDHPAPRLLGVGEIDPNAPLSSSFEIR